MINDISTTIQQNFEAKDRARETGLALSREVVRTCGTAIRHIHRGDFENAVQLLEKARSSLQLIDSRLAGYPDIYYGGFVEHAQQEFVECAVVYNLLCEKTETIPSPEELGVGYTAYLHGLGDVIGELRRHILDLIRHDMPGDGELFLDIMDDIYSTLMMFDYPDAMTRGLRRKTDVARSLIERTRGDLTNAIRQQKLEDLLRKSESRLSL